MVYNFPTVTAGIDLDSDIILTLSDHPNIVGTKLSCGNHRKAPSNHFRQTALGTRTLAGVRSALTRLAPRERWRHCCTPQPRTETTHEDVCALPGGKDR